MFTFVCRQYLVKFVTASGNLLQTVLQSALDFKNHCPETVESRTVLILVSPSSRLRRYDGALQTTLASSVHDVRRWLSTGGSLICRRHWRMTTCVPHGGVPADNQTQHGSEAVSKTRVAQRMTGVETYPGNT